MDTRVQPKSLTPAARAILDSASRLFYEQGINSVGVDTISADAGVTKKTLYDQFGSKAALVVAYLDERDQDYRDWVARTLTEVDDDGDAKVLAVFDALQSWMDEHSPLGCAFVHAHSELVGTADHPAHEVLRGGKLWIKDLFADLTREAGHPDADSLSVQLLTLIEGATVLRSISDLPEAMPAARRAAATLLRSANA
ncbi:TetR/AcrR family transcriptional regulator [Gordonia sp. HY285]|uniref:TetR/AcrR family transcriptional regulator n=1 Tax=Gordonia liuliyuniae TaxID=2911517 RepID=UPI001F193D0A|nr:TetR/AcrR family transcriptional regulator [Gordonia liuliyuniae]MCF8609209.1 TetR/AcrR family transcriptional regulator [Gordonia liuliyuniae]